MTSSVQTSDDSGKKQIESRRMFLGSTFAASMAATIVPRHVLGMGYLAPSETINVAGIGAGGMGGGDINRHAGNGANIVALCDVDDRRAAGTYNKFPKATRYKDFRILLEQEEKNIDAVTVGTPDHIHAPASLMAINMGKHVYCQKPMTHTLHEARVLTRAAEKAGVVTQMGNQGHGAEGARLTNEWIQSGLIGDVTEVHVWSDRPGGWWPQGVSKATDTPSVPSELDWDLWLGPAADRAYHSDYVPFKWRGWWDFGTGALGDMGCHIIDHPYWALNLGAPDTVEARNTIEGSRLEKNKWNFETYPKASMIHYNFPARGDLPPVKMTWYDGGLMPATPDEMPANESLPSNGALYIGSKGKMYHSSHGGKPQVIPVELREAAQAIPKTIARSRGHYKEWFDACRGEGETVCHFGYAGPMTETVLLGVLALRAPGERLHWDSTEMKVANKPELNQFVSKEYRKGWEI
ncbi:Gfo/Idh/MocA family oxidoreductase [Planctomycetaceae bacterium]|nr:Gfo/Idh/MocA family oxidoreductase [Planctomycetaceae bacterium]